MGSSYKSFTPARIPNAENASHIIISGELVRILRKLSILLCLTSSGDFVFIVIILPETKSHFSFVDTIILPPMNAGHASLLFERYTAYEVIKISLMHHHYKYFPTRTCMQKDVTSRLWASCLSAYRQRSAVSRSSSEWEKYVISMSLGDMQRRSVPRMKASA